MKDSLKHLAIILDGNGRWAKKRGLDRSEGHKAGAENLVLISRALEERNISFLTVYAFSTENWKRPAKEVKLLMDLLISFINKYLPEFMERKVKIRVMGDLSRLPFLSRKAVEAAIKKTSQNNRLTINIGLNYGAKDEIIRAFKKYIKEDPGADSLDSESFENFLDTADLPPVDLLIRSGGEKRLSNFMLWQLAYSELYFTDKLWPDFSPLDLDQAIDEFYKRDRRYGGVR